MNTKLTQQLLLIEELERTIPDATLLKLTPSRITIQLKDGSTVYVGFK